ncbi:MAG: hypothetical protein AB1478_11615 [Nitrospirota bacterium]
MNNPEAKTCKGSKCERCKKDFIPGEINKVTCNDCYYAEFDRIHSDCGFIGGECYYYEGMECIATDEGQECYECDNFPDRQEG